MFKVGGAVCGQDFVGRQAEIDRIVSAMKANNNISIYGMARIGKSSIIKEIIHRANTTELFSKKPLFFQYRLTQDKNIRIHFFEDLKDFIADLVEEYDGEATNEIESLKRLISRVEGKLQEREVSHERYIRMCEKITNLYDNDIWIILDEMDYANTALGSYIQKIREIVTSDRVHVINISRHSLTSIFPANGNGSNYPGIVTQNIPIVGFSEEDSQSFKERFISKIGSEKADKMWESILEYAGNVPYFLALLANGMMTNKEASVAEIAENPYSKYIETLKYWHESLYSDNMLENVLKYIDDPHEAEATNLRVFGIVQNGRFSVPWFATYIQNNRTDQQRELEHHYTELLTKIHVLLTQGEAILHGVLRDTRNLRRIELNLKELESMKLKIECMKVLNENNTFVRIMPSIEEVNMFDMKIRDINDLFEQLEV